MQSELARVRTVRGRHRRTHVHRLQIAVSGRARLQLRIWLRHACARHRKRSLLLLNHKELFDLFCILLFHFSALRSNRRQSSLRSQATISLLVRRVDLTALEQI